MEAIAPKIRPSLRDLLQNDPDELGYDPNAAPAVKVSRARPPTLQQSTSQPNPVPEISRPVSTASLRSSFEAKPKPKSRFALERERQQALQRQQQAAEKRGQQFGAAADAENRSEQENDSSFQDVLPRASLPGLVRGVVERNTESHTAPTAPSLNALPFGPSFVSDTPEKKNLTGFPISQHLLFSRKTVASKKEAPTSANSSRTEPAYSVQSSSTPSDDSQPTSALLESVSAENDRKLANMSEAEILEQQREIRESLGLSPEMLKMLADRGKRKAEQASKEIISGKGKEKEIHTEERNSQKNEPTNAPNKQTFSQNDEAAEEGSPEYIRKHFFPNEAINPNLDWMKSSALTGGNSTRATENSSAVNLLSFDLHGNLLENESALGDEIFSNTSSSHHVSSASTFTIVSLLSLTGSSVPSQRSTAFQILDRILASQTRAATRSRLGAGTWDQVRLDVLRQASWAVRDKNVGVATAAISLVEQNFEQEKFEPIQRKTNLAPNEEKPASIISIFLSTSPLEVLAQHLQHSFLPHSSLQQILQILFSFLELANSDSSDSNPDIELLSKTPNLLEAVSSQFISVPWPITPSSQQFPSPLALDFNILLAKSGRTRAKAFSTRNLCQAPMRFLAVPPWELEQEADRILAYKLLTKTFQFWETLARYGIATSLRTTAGILLEQIFDKIREFTAENEERTLSTPQISMTTQFLSLLNIWTIAAIDPHVTDHDILWSHLQGWHEFALGLVEWSIVSDTITCDRNQVLTASVNLLASWLAGSKLNQSWRGEEERKWINENLGHHFKENGKIYQLVLKALESLARADSDNQEDNSRLILSCVQLSNAYEEDSNPSTPSLFYLPANLVNSAFDALLTSAASSLGWCTVRLLVLLLRHVTTTAPRFIYTLRVLELLRPGDEVAAKNLLEWIIRTLSAAANHAFLPPVAQLDVTHEQRGLYYLAQLKPFLLSAIVSKTGGKLIAPNFPEPKDLKLSAAMHPFAPKGEILTSDWPLTALNELLRSGSSAVLLNLPLNWNGSELQIVKTSLSLLRVVLNCRITTLQPTILIYDIIKTFMLEKDSAASSGESGAIGEIFRDESVQFLLRNLLEPLTLGNRSKAKGESLVMADTRTAEETLQFPSSLISSAPFYQLYSDLLGLYDSISLGDQIFAQILLPPLAMAYPVDYRRTFWSDWSGNLGSITTRIDNVVCDLPLDSRAGFASFLFPSESDEIVLRAMTNSLITSQLDRKRNPFLYMVAVHHLTRLLFDPKFADVSEGRKRIQSQLAKGIKTQASETLIQDLLSCNQTCVPGEVLKMAEAVWDAAGPEFERRKQILTNL